MRIEETISKEYSKDIIENESKIQNKLQKAKDKFVSDKIIAADVLECTYISSNEIKHNGNIYNISKSKYGEKYFKKGTTVYLPVFVLEYSNLYQSFSNGWYYSEDDANQKIRDLCENNKDEFRFKIDSEDDIIHNNSKHKMFEKFKRKDIFKIYTNLDSFLLLMIPILIALMMFVLTKSHTIYYEYFSDYTIKEIYLMLSYIILAIIPVSAQYIISNILNNFEKYSLINIDSKIIMDSNLLAKNDTDYKVITADVTVDSSGLKLSSDELDCEWFYKRKNNQLLTESGIKLINKLPVSNNECVITVKDNGYNDSPWASSDGNWWIDIKSSL